MRHWAHTHNPMAGKRSCINCNVFLICHVFVCLHLYCNYTQRLRDSNKWWVGVRSAFPLFFSSSGYNVYHTEAVTMSYTPPSCTCTDQALITCNSYGNSQ